MESPKRGNSWRTVSDNVAARRAGSQFWASHQWRPLSARYESRDESRRRTRLKRLRRISLRLLPDSIHCDLKKPRVRQLFELFFSVVIGLLPYFALAFVASNTRTSHAQAVQLPSAMRPAEPFPIVGVMRGDSIGPIPGMPLMSQVSLGDGRSASLALAPYGYQSGFPAPIAESADQASSLPPHHGAMSGPSILQTPPLVVAPPAFSPPGVADPIVQDGQVILPGELPLEVQPNAPFIVQAKPKGTKDGMLQQVSFLTTYLPRFNDDGLGMVDFENSVMIAFPFPTRNMPLVLTPGFDFHLLDGPAPVDLPPQLYDLYLQVRWLTKISERWSLTLAATPGYYTDFEGDHTNALRVSGQLMAIWEWRPQSKFIFGVVYLDREDIPVLPAGGLIWTPNEDNRLELIFPRPRFLHRFRATAVYEDWWYVGAEFGGGEWAIQRAAGFDDIVDLTDYRVTAGVERKSVDYLVGMRAELGYVFGREIEYQSGTPGFEPADTMLVRAGFFY